MLTAPDQLRQRVAFALASMFVVSTNSVNARAVTTYQNTLANDAFANFYTIMQDVTLSPAMGGYLNMLNSNKPGVVDGVAQIANENYARELMQLFTTGIVHAEPGREPAAGCAAGIRFLCIRRRRCRRLRGRLRDGRMLTLRRGGRSKFPNAANYTAANGRCWRAQHDMTAKVLLNGTTLPAGQSTTQDLQGR